MTITEDVCNGYLIEVNGSVEGDSEGFVWIKTFDEDTDSFQAFYGSPTGDLRAYMLVKIQRDLEDQAKWRVVKETISLCS